MYELDKVLEFLKDNLDDFRYGHSIRVMETAVEPEKIATKTDFKAATSMARDTGMWISATSKTTFDRPNLIPGMGTMGVTIISTKETMAAKIAKVPIKVISLTLILQSHPDNFHRPRPQ